MKRKIKKVGILGGTFDPCHLGHLKISKEARAKFKLSKVIWAITNKSPFKNKSAMRLEQRIKVSKRFTKTNKFIQICYFEKLIKSNKTVDLLDHLKKKLSNTELYLIIGADNLVTFHKWKKWRNISQKCKILVFDRSSYKSKALKSLAFKQISKEKLKFINFKKVNISSSQLRKI